MKHGLQRLGCQGGVCGLGVWIRTAELERLRVRKTSLTVREFGFERSKALAFGVLVILDLQSCRITAHPAPSSTKPERAEPLKKPETLNSYTAPDDPLCTDLHPSDILSCT